MSSTGSLGEVVTFYSYKGGTGRSMMLANVAWILATNARRVLAIDWDLEAPGLHRYFQPFLLDPDLTDTDGVIDFVTDFAVAAVTPDEESSRRDHGREWFHPYADITRYATPLQWEFGDGALDFVAAGRQGASYSTRVNSFHWHDFYERFGGGAFLEQMKAVAKGRYDYVLIDSRTGVSDTSGICTVQLPDTLVVCFTLNNQNVDGAAGVAASVLAKRPDIRILPIPMRIENSEKERLELRRSRARRRFAGVMGGARGEGDPEEFWAASEVLYVPFYAYEEVLAAFGDPIGSPLTMLGAAERLTGRLTHGAVSRSARIPEARRAQVLAEYAGTVTRATRGAPVIPGQYVYLTYGHEEATHAHRLYDALVSALGHERVVLDVASLSPGADYVTAIEQAVTSAAVVVAVIGPEWAKRERRLDSSDATRLELALALQAPGVRVIPTLVDGARLSREEHLPAELSPILRRQAIELTAERWSYDVRRLVATVELAIADGARSIEGVAAGEGTLFTPSASSADVIDSVLQGSRPGSLAAIRRLLAREPVLVVVLSTVIAPLLVIFNAVQLTSISLATLVVALSSVFAVIVRAAATPGEEREVEGRSATRSNWK